MPDDDLDLLAGHFTAEEILFKDELANDNQILVWKKLENTGYTPANREGHTSTTFDNGIIVYGGLEASKRISSVLNFSLPSGTWNLWTLPSKSSPPPRAHHAASSVRHLLIVHGGEGDRDDLNPGVCPGDTIQGLKIGPSVRLSTPNNNKVNVAKCLDDFWLLDTQKKNWYKIKTNLAPLPRRGHSISNVYVEGKASLLFFGGYSSDNVTTSNTLFSCSAEEIWNYFQVCQKILDKGEDPNLYINDSLNKKNSILKPINLETDLLSIVFRTIQVKGAPPPPRHRHSATMINYPFLPSQLQPFSSFYPFSRDNSTPLSQYLVIIGGLDAQSHIPLNDVYILDVNNFQWCTLSRKGLKPCPPLSSKGTSSYINNAQIVGDGPNQGIFGHCTIGPIKYNHLIDKEREKKRDDKDDINNVGEKLPGRLNEYEILVFGGSSHAQNYRSRCYSTLFSFSLKTGEWCRVNTGHSFPSSRLSHTSSYISNWSPINPMRPRSVSTGLINEDTDLSIPTSSQTQSCAIIFGGIGATPVGGDTWALNLDYKSSGVDQYDDSASHRVTKRLSLTSDMDEEIYLLNEEDFIVGSARSTTNLNNTNNSLTSISSNKIISHNNSKYLLKTSSSVPLLNSSKPTNLQESDHDVGIAIKSIKSSRPFSESSKSRCISKSFDFLDESEQADLNSILLKVKKERALTEIQLKEEKEKYLNLENDMNELKKKFNFEKISYEDNISENNKEIKELKDSLAASLNREQQLKDLNREAYLILSLQGLAPPSHPII